MKLAYFSPLNPQPSGISDYSEELLPYLAVHAAIDLFVDGLTPTNLKITSQFKCFDYQRDPSALKSLRGYDAVVYHMGNDHRYHAGIYEALTKHPGVVVFHDFALQDFFLGLARAKSNIELYLAEVAACHGKTERVRAEEHLRRGSVPPQVAAPLNFPLNCRAANAAEGIIVHSQWSLSRFERLAPAVPSKRVPMPVTGLNSDRPSKAAAANKDRAVAISSFGLITPDKGIELTLRALSELRDEYDFNFTLVGAENSYFDVRALINQYGLTNRVKITGHVALPEFERHISETDIAINLRQRTVGETSASLYRIMAASVPAIVSNVGAFAELPNDAVVKIDHDGYTVTLLQAYLRKLIEDSEFRIRIGANARRHVLSEHDAEQSAAHYVDFIREVITNRSRQQLLNKVSEEVASLAIRPTDDAILRDLATEVALLVPAEARGAIATTALRPRPTSEIAAPNSHDQFCGNGQGEAHSSADPGGRLPRIEGVDYKRAAIEYPSKLDEERSYYLRTKPFYNLKNKPVKHLGEGMDAETHRHFCDFANIAAALALPAGGSILDVGCGSGWLSEYFARLGYKVLGIDISEDLIQMARERVERVPYNVDHETSLQCSFLKHDIESTPLRQKFDAIICYDALHHFEDERAVFAHLAAMLNIGGLLFILEGQKPSAGSATEDELREVMRNYGTLESPFSDDYLRSLLNEHGFAIVGDYVSVNGLFEREMLEGDRLPLTTLATDYHYFTCKKVSDGASASTVPDSRTPGLLRARFSLRSTPPKQIPPGALLTIPLVIQNTGDTLWLAGQTVREGVVMPAVRVFMDDGTLISEFHGQPRLPSAVAPGEIVEVRIDYVVPQAPGSYLITVDLVDQHRCWFEDHGSEPFVCRFEVETK